MVLAKMRGEGGNVHDTHEAHNHGAEEEHRLNSVVVEEPVAHNAQQGSRIEPTLLVELESTSGEKDERGHETNIR